MEWRKWCNCRTFQKGSLKVPVALIHAVIEGQRLAVRKWAARPDWSKVLNSGDPKPGRIPGFLKIGSRGEAWVERKVEKTVLRHIRSMVPSKGCAFNTGGRLSKQHRAPFNGISV